jgi:hypothetical protein
MLQVQAWWHLADRGAQGRKEGGPTACAAPTTRVARIGIVYRLRRPHLDTRRSGRPQRKRHSCWPTSRSWLAG